MEQHDGPGAVDDIRGLPRGDERMPAAVARLARGEASTPVWHNEVGGLTFRIGAGTPRDRHIKWMPIATAATEPSLEAEAERLRWAARYIAVPRVLETGSDAEGSWLVTETIPVPSAVAPAPRDPARMVVAIARGLRRMHDRLPVETCPFSWSVASRLAAARRAGRADAAAGLPPTPPVDRVVVCHGDACAPNTLVDDAGEPVAHVDLGALGVADRWADLAVASLSLGWNFGPSHDDLFYRAYGIEPDAERIAFYRALWDVG